MRILYCKNKIFITLIVSIFILLSACSPKDIENNEGNLPNSAEHPAGTQDYDGDKSLKEDTVPTDQPIVTQSPTGNIWPYEFEVLFSEDQTQNQEYVFSLGMHKDDVKRILKERNVKIFLDYSHGSYGSSLYGENIRTYYDTDGKLKELYISDKMESSKGLRIGDGIEKVYEIYGKEHRSMDEREGTSVRYIYSSNIFFVFISEDDKVVEGMGIEVLDEQDEFSAYESAYEEENKYEISMSPGAGSGLPKDDMKKMLSVRGSYYKDIEGKRVILKIGSNPFHILFEFEVENTVELEGEAKYISIKVDENEIDWYTKAVYEDGAIIFERLDNGNMRVDYPDRPDYSGEWLRDEIEEPEWYEM
jgi:hypothetical protein